MPKAELRRMFNHGRYWARAESGELSARVQRDGHPSPDHSGEPYCARSQIVGYDDPLVGRVAVVHQYLRENGTVGGSGRPDPKQIVEAGIVYRPTEREG